MIAWAALASAALLAVGSELTEAQFRTAVDAAPKDVARYVERRAGCNHWLGEEPYDKPRAAEINRVVRQLRCERLDRDEMALRARYGAKPDLLKLIDLSREMLGF